MTKPDGGKLEMSAEEVAMLSKEDAFKRVHDLIAYGNSLIDWVISSEESTAFRKPKSEEDTSHFRKVVATAILYSGGNDSTAMAHIFRHRSDYAIHANTTIGIEQTRQFVRDTCEDWGLPLLEKYAPVSYRDLVLDQGFPGPGHHWKMYQRLKERCLEQARKDIIGSKGRSQRVIFLGGRRRTESERRANIGEIDYKGSTIFVSPMVYWTKIDLNNYRRLNSDLPRNEVSDMLHMSGECLCGSFAHPGELEEIEMWFPEVAQEIRDLEVEVAATGKHPESRCRWGRRPGKPTDKVGMLCSSCEFRATGDAETLVVK